MAKPKQPHGPAMTLGNMRGVQGVEATRVTGFSRSCRDA